MKISSIGSYCIVAPVLNTLRLEDGERLYQQRLKPIEDGFMQGNSEIHILMPENLPVMSHDNQKVVMAEFFIGLLEPLLIRIRNEMFSENDINLRRKRMRVVANQPNEQESALDAFKSIFQDSNDIYDVMDKWCMSRIKMGIQLDDGSRYVMELDEEFMQVNEPPETVRIQVAHWSDKFMKAFDAMYLSNLTIVSKAEKSKQGPVVT